jgi:DNA-binding beta-propeller fold protein YncE
MSDDESPPNPVPPPRRIWRRFGLRTLFVLIAICAVLLTFVGRRYYQDYLRQAAIDAIEARGGKILRREGRVYRVYLRGDKFDDATITELAPHLHNLTELEQFDLAQTPTTDASIPALLRIAQVREMRIFETQLTKQGIKTLQDALIHTKISELKPDPVATGLAKRRIYRHAIVTAAFSPDSKTLFAGSGEGELIAFDAYDGEVVAQIPAHENWLFGVAVSPDGKTLATGGGDNLVQLWDRATLERRATLAGHTNDVHSVAFNAESNVLYSAGDDRTLRAWNLATREAIFEVDAHDGSIPSLAYSPKYRLVATGSRDDTVKLWNATNGRLVQTLAEHTDDINGIAFSDDGEQLASGSYDGTVRLWNPTSSSATRVLRCGVCRVHAVRFSPGGDAIAAASSDGRVRIWEASTGRLVRTLTDQDCPANLAFSRDGQYFATTAADGSAVLRSWNAPRQTTAGTLWEAYVIPVYIAGP